MHNKRHNSFGIINVIIFHSPESDSADYLFLEPVYKASVGQSLESMYSNYNEVIFFLI